MATLTIDNKQYEIEKLSPEAQTKLNSARFCDQKIEQLEAELAVVRTARTAYLQALPDLLNNDAIVSAPAKKAAAKKPTVRKPAAKKPAAKKPIARKPKTATTH
ncbi:DUF6447 family protein [Neptunomonas sp.]|uniref:DUF6447 family protein n=1 Tax=Neptunomonas sp. TaxID=1971898 RepID=UPI0026003E39|nr:DUF6447 family protein [Neptunomonas sp.]